MRCSWLTLLTLVIAGCGKDTAQPAKQVAPNAKAKAHRTEDDKVALAVDLLRQAEGPGQYREALGMLTGNLSRGDVAAKTRLSPEQRQFLEKAGLTPAERDDLDANTFRPLDVHHLEATAMFHDAARFLEVNGLGELEQAGHVLDWVTRHAATRAEQELVIASLRAKCDILWAQLDALYFAYVTPGWPPPGAFRMEGA